MNPHCNDPCQLPPNSCPSSGARRRSRRSRSTSRDQDESPKQADGGASAGGAAASAPPNKEESKDSFPGYHTIAPNQKRRQKVLRQNEAGAQVEQQMKAGRPHATPGGDKLGGGAPIQDEKEIRRQRQERMAKPSRRLSRIRAFQPEGGRVLGHGDLSSDMEGLSLDTGLSQEAADEAYGLLLVEIDSFPSPPDASTLYTTFINLRGFLQKASQDPSKRKIKVASDAFSKRMGDLAIALPLLSWAGFSDWEGLNGDGVPTHVSMPDDFASSVVLRARIRAIQWQIESMDGSVAGPECGGGGVTSSRETQPTERPRAMSGLSDTTSGSRGGCDDDDDVPAAFICRISNEVMEDPVIASDGHSYSRHGIQEWMDTFPPHQMPRSPATGLVLESRALIPNHSLRQAIDEWMATR